MRARNKVGAFVCALFVCAAILFWAHPKTAVAPPHQTTTNPPAKESIVRFPSSEAKEKFLKQNNLKESDLHPSAALSGTYVVAVPNDKLKSDGSTVAPRREYRALLTPNDTIYPQWYSSAISAPGAWDISTGSSSVTVAVIDTGFALSHEDLANRWATNSGEVGGGKETNGVDDDHNGKIDDWRGWDFANADNNPVAGTLFGTQDDADHGTITSGLVGATGNNAKGVASINWGVKLLPLQVLTDNGIGFTDDVAAAVDYAVARGAKVISMSLGTTDVDPTLEASINNAISAGVTVVAAAGNCGDPFTYQFNGCTTVGQMLYPAKYSSVVAVGATDPFDNQANFSSYGPEIDIVAPGSGSIRSTDWSSGNQTSLYTSEIYGTSFSTPIVAGVAALYKGLVPSAGVTEITQALEYGADKVSGMQDQNYSINFGYGRVNAQATAKLASVTHPDGTLVINRATGAVYLIDNGQKRYVPDPPTFLSHYRDILAQSKPATLRDLDLPNGSNLDFKSGVVVKGSGLALYAVDNVGGTLYKRYIPSAAVHNGLGFSEAERIQVSDSFLSSLADGGTLSATSQHPNGSVVIAPDGITVYLIDNGTKRHVTDPYALMSLNKGKYFVKPATAADMSLTTGTDLGLEEGALVKATDGPAVYTVNINGSTTEKRHVASSFIYNLLGYQNNEWLNVPPAELPSTTGTDIN